MVEVVMKMMMVSVEVLAGIECIHGACGFIQ